MYAKTPGFRKNATPTNNPPPRNTADFGCYLPNAAIGWKQPNGFYYPPSFHSNNLFFDNVDIRHYVIDAPFAPGSYFENSAVKEAEFCKTAGDATYPIYFTSFTDIDRQTELNDDDGTLTGLTNKYTPPSVQPPPPLPGIGTISVNPADYFNAPIETAEYLSNLGVTPDKACPLQATTTPTTAKTSPYDYVTTVVYPGCAVGATGPGACGSFKDTKEDPAGSGRFPNLMFGRGGTWSQECSNPACYGVPLFRQLLTDAEQATYSGKSCATNPNQAACRFPFVRMGGQSTYQRSSLTVNHGVYYLDTSVKRDTQVNEALSPAPYIECSNAPTGPCQPRSVNEFQGSTSPTTGTYYMFFLFAKTSTRQTYQIYVGPGFNLGSVQAAQAALAVLPVSNFTPIAWPTAWTKDLHRSEAPLHDRGRRHARGRLWHPDDHDRHDEPDGPDSRVKDRGQPWPVQAREVLQGDRHDLRLCAHARCEGPVQDPMRQGLRPVGGEGCRLPRFRRLRLLLHPAAGLLGRRQRRLPPPDSHDLRRADDR